MNKILTALVMGLIFAAAPAQAAVVVLDIFFDEYPEETSFGIWELSAAPTLEMINTGLTQDDYFAGEAYDVDLSSPIGFGDGYALSGDFLGEAPGPWQFVWNLSEGDYVFGIFDAFGDGICCEFGDGSFTLSVDGDVVIGGGAFSSFALAKFESTTPIPVPGALILFGSVVAGWIGFGRKAA